MTQLLTDEQVFGAQAAKPLLSDEQVFGAAAAPAAPAPVIAEVPLPTAAPRAKTLSEYPLQPEVQGVGRGLASLVGMGEALTPVGMVRQAAHLAKNLPSGYGGDAAAKVSSVVGEPMQSALVKAATNTAGKVGVPVADYSNAGWGESFRTNAADLGVQALVGAGGLVKAAGARAAEIAQGSMPRAFDSFLRPYMTKNVAPTLVGDAAATAGAAAGKTAVDQYDSVAGVPLKGNPIAEGAGMLLGGIGGITALGTAKAIGGGIVNAVKRQAGLDVAPVNIDPVTGQPVSMAAYDAAAEKARSIAAYPDEAGARMQANAAELRALDPNAPMPSPAALAEDPGLAGLESMVNRGAPGEAAKRQREFSTGVRDTVERVAPEGATPQPLVDAVRREADARMQYAGAAEDNVRFDANAAQRAAEQEVARLEQRVAQLEGRQQQVADIRGDRGAELRNMGGRSEAASASLDRAIVDQGYIPARTEKNRLYNEGVPLDTPVDLTGARSAADEVQGRVAQLPPSMRDSAANPALLDDMAQMGGATYDQARQIRMALSDEAAKARKAGEFGQADNIDTLRRPFNAAIDAANPAAEANYRENFAPRYRPGPNDEAAKFTRAVDRDPTRSATPPSQTAARFLQEGQPEKRAALTRMIEGSQDPVGAQSAAREYLLADLGPYVVDPRTGVIRPDRLRQWQERWGDLSNVVPGFQNDLNQLRREATQGARVAERGAVMTERAGENLNTARGQARDTVARFEDEIRNAQKNSQMTQAEIDKGALGLVLNADVDKTVAAIMSRPNETGRMFDDLLRTVGNDEQARNGLKAAVRDYLIEKATGNATERLNPGDRRGPVSWSKLNNLFKEHERELAKVFSPEEMNTLRAGHRALELANVERFRVTTGSDSAEKMQPMFDQMLNSPIGKGVEAALRIKYGLLKTGGLISTGRRLMSGATGGPDPVEVSRLLERASVDPDLMGMLLGRKVPVASPAWNKKMQQLLAVKEATDTD